MIICYLPASWTVTLAIYKLPAGANLYRVLGGTVASFLRHCMDGRGSPSALHGSSRLLPGNTSISKGPNSNFGGVAGFV